MVDAFTTGSLSAMLFTRFGKRLDLLTNSQAIDANLRVIVVQVVQAALREGWAQALVEAAAAERPQNPLFREFAAAYRSQSVPLTSDPYDAYELRGRRLFIDRKPLRAALRQLNTAVGPRGLVVDGPHGSGRASADQLSQQLAASLRG